LTIVGLIIVGIPWSSRAGAAELSWARGFGGGSADLLYGVALDGNGDTLAVGEFSGTVDFDPGPGVTQLTADSGTAVFAIKLDADGALVWARKIDGTNGTHVRDLALDAAGALHLVGSFAATADFDPGPGTSLLTSAGLSDAYAVKLDSDGDLVWAVRWGNTANDSADAVAVAADGTPWVAWTSWRDRSYSDGNWELYARALVDGGAPVCMSRSPRCDFGPRLVAGASELALAWIAAPPEAVAVGELKALAYDNWSDKELQVSRLRDGAWSDPLSAPARRGGREVALDDHLAVLPSEVDG